MSLSKKPLNDSMRILYFGFKESMVVTGGALRSIKLASNANLPDALPSNLQGTDVSLWPILRSENFISDSHIKESESPESKI